MCLCVVYSHRIVQVTNDENNNNKGKEGKKVETWKSPLPNNGNFIQVMYSKCLLVTVVERRKNRWISFWWLKIWLPCLKCEANISLFNWSRKGRRRTKSFLFENFENTNIVFQSWLTDWFIKDTFATSTQVILFWIVFLGLFSSNFEQQFIEKGRKKNFLLRLLIRTALTGCYVRWEKRWNR